MLAGVGDLVTGRVVGPPEHVAVERRGAVGVRRPHRHVTDVAVLDRDQRPGHRAGQHPSVPERVDDGCTARAVVLVGLALHLGAVGPGPLECLVGIGDRQHQAHRNRLWRGCSQSDLGILVGQVEHAAAEREFGVADAPVVHDDRLADHRRAQRVDVPVDGVARAGDGEVRQRGGSGHGGLGRRRGGVQFGDHGVGATHDNSFCSIRQGHSGFQPRAQARGELGIRSHRKVAVTQHGQWIVIVDWDIPRRSARPLVRHDTPPSGYSFLNARRARTSSASVACTVRPINSAHSPTEQSSR